MGIKMGKKAFFYTTIGIALSVVLLLSYNVYTSYSLKDEMKTVEVRAITMDNLKKYLEDDIESAIFIIGFRSLLSLEDYVMKYDKFFNDANPPATPSLAVAFQDVFINGLINNEKMGLMENNTLINWTEKMKAEANKTGIALSFGINSVTISHTSPWLVDVTLSLDIDIEDAKNTAEWSIAKTYRKSINITGFVDPLYLVNANGLANNTIRETPYSSFPTNLPAHLNGAYYRAHADAPTYLMRFENNLGSSAYGIESLVTKKLKDNGFVISAKSAVDFIYFGATNPASCNVQEISDTDFRLDYPTHRDFYGATCV